MINHEILFTRYPTILGYRIKWETNHVTNFLGHGPVTSRTSSGHHPIDKNECGWSPLQGSYKPWSGSEMCTYWNLQVNTFENKNNLSHSGYSICKQRLIVGTIAIIELWSLAKSPHWQFLLLLGKYLEWDSHSHCHCGYIVFPRFKSGCTGAAIAQKKYGFVPKFQ